MKDNRFYLLPLSLICALSLNAQAATTTTAPAPTGTTAATAPAAPAAPGSTTAVKPAAPAAAKAKTATKPAAGTNKTKAPEKAPEPAKLSFNLSFDASYTLQAEKPANDPRAQSMSYELTPGMGYGDYSAFAYFSYTQDLIDSTAPSWSDPLFGAGRKAWSLGEYFTLGPSGTIILPMTDATKNEVGLLYNIGGALKLGLKTKAIGLDNWSIAYSVAYNRNFTKFDTNARTNSPNTMSRIRQRFDVNYNITDSLSFFNRFQFDSNTSVYGVVRNSFLFVNSFSYQINDVVGVSLSHANGGSLLKPETYQNNLKLYDSESSEYSVGLSLGI
jgi:hypothetical protein